MSSGGYGASEGIGSSGTGSGTGGSPGYGSSSTSGLGTDTPTAETTTLPLTSTLNSYLSAAGSGRYEANTSRFRAKRTPSPYTLRPPSRGAGNRSPVYGTDYSYLTDRPGVSFDALPSSWASGNRSTYSDTRSRTQDNRYRDSRRHDGGSPYANGVARPVEGFDSPSYGGGYGPGSAAAYGSNGRALDAGAYQSFHDAGRPSADGSYDAGGWASRDGTHGDTWRDDLDSFRRGRSGRD